MSALSDRSYGLARAGALISARPAAFFLSTLLLALTLAIALFVALVGYGVWPWANQIRPRPEVSAFLAPGLAAPEIEAVKSALWAVEGVRGVRWIARDQALSELAKRYGLGATPGDVRPNPLPDVLIAHFDPGIAADQVARQATAIKALAGVSSVRADLDWYRRWLAIEGLGSLGMIAVTGLALLLVVLLVMTAVREHTNIRSTEIEVLRLVGATPAFVARPYVYVVAFSLTLATLLALAAATAGLALIRPQIEAMPGHTGGLRLPPLWVAGALLAAAWVSGVLCGRLALHQAIRSKSPASSEIM
jgi:cell division transport system permease protein